MKLTKEQIIKCAQEWADYYVDLGWREKVESGELPPWESWYVRDDGIPGYEVNGIRWYPDVSTDEWEFTMDAQHIIIEVIISKISSMNKNRNCMMK